MCCMFATSMVNMRFTHSKKYQHVNTKLWSYHLCYAVTQNLGITAHCSCSQSVVSMKKQVLISVTISRPHITSEKNINCHSSPGALPKPRGLYELEQESAKLRQNKVLVSCMNLFSSLAFDY